MDELTLSADDVNAICERMLRPEVRAQQRGSWDVIADFSGFAAEAVKRNQAQAEAEKRRDESESAELTRVIGTNLFQKPE